MWQISDFIHRCHIKLRIPAPGSSWRSFTGLFKLQGKDISMMDAAGGLIIGGGSLSQCNYQSANVCSCPRWEEPPYFTSGR